MEIKFRLIRRHHFHGPQKVSRAPPPRGHSPLAGIPCFSGLKKEISRAPASRLNALVRASFSMKNCAPYHGVSKSLPSWLRRNRRLSWPLAVDRE